jgi:tetratricopeptide (TPR) repeat protein
VRAALEWALATPTASGAALELTGALFWFWTKRGQFREGAQWLERALATSSETATSMRARALTGLGHMDYFQGHPRDVQPVVERALALGHELASARVISTCLFMQGLLAFESGNNETAAALAEDARRIAVDGGEPAEEAPPLITLASLAAADGDYERAQALYDRSIEVQRQVGELWGLSISLLVAASLRIVRDEFEHAQTQASEALALCEQLDDRRGVAWSFNVFAGLFAARGESATAAQLWGASDALLESVGGVIMPPLTWIRDRHFERVRTALGAESFSAFYKEGRSASGSMEVRVT